MRLLRNVQIHTMDEAFTTAEAIAWENGRIVEIGSDSALSEKYRNAEALDGRGQTVLPGFIDPHIHFMDGVVLQGGIDCSPETVSTVPELQQLLSKVVDSGPGEDWIVGLGLDPWAFPGKRGPSRFDIDAVAPDQPVFLMHYSVHECFVNTRALEIAGIDRYTPQPFGGEIEKDRKGEPTGRLIETAHGRFMSLAVDSMIKNPNSGLAEKLEEMQAMLFNLGVTRIGDPAVSSSKYSLYKQFITDGTLQIPITVYPCNDMNMFSLPWDKTAEPHPWPHLPGLTTGPIKIFLDGADRAAVALSLAQFLKSVFRTCLDVVRLQTLDPLRTTMRSPFRFGRDMRFHFGTRMAKTAECSRLVQEAVVRGFMPAFHAIGNEAVEQALEILKSAGISRQSISARIEHALFLDDALVAAMRDAGLAVVTQPYFLTHMGKDNVPHMPGIKQLPLRTLIDAGVPVCGSSDWPVTSCDPLLAVEHAVTRVTTGREVLQAQEAISIREAFCMYTRWAAEILGCTEETGSLSIGKRADFIMLSADPFVGGFSDAQKACVVCTVLNGDVVYSSG